MAGDDKTSAPMEVEAPAASAEDLAPLETKHELVKGEALSERPEKPIKDGDLYATFKQAEADRDFLDVQEQYIKDEIKNLKRELIRAKEEIKRIQSVPLVIGQFNEMVDATYGIASSTAGSIYYVRVLSTLDREKLKPNSSVALHRHSHSVVDVLPPESDSTIQLMMERPTVTYKDIGGLDIQKQEMREAVELPLTQFQLYKQIGIDPPRGVLMYGPPGTGKTMLAKAVATEGGAAFLAIDASAIENKWLGESEKNAKAVFSLARRLAPCVVFIDEVDAVLSSREGGDDTSHGTLTSVKTTLMQEWDGLRTTTDRVVVIGSTNRPYDLDEAALRRLPRRILVDLPDAATREAILRVTLRENRLEGDVDLAAVAERLKGYSGSDCKEICREAIVRISHEQAALLEAADTAARLGAAADAALDPPPLRAANMADFDAALDKLAASVAESGPEMAKVLEWNAQYGEVKKKAKAAPTSLYL